MCNYAQVFRNSNAIHAPVLLDLSQRNGGQVFSGAFKQACPETLLKSQFERVKKSSSELAKQDIMLKAVGVGREMRRVAMVAKKAKSGQGEVNKQTNLQSAALFSAVRNHARLNGTLNELSGLSMNDIPLLCKLRLAQLVDVRKNLNQLLLFKR